ncbi:hypothetical protein HF086_009812 [Spodoptera exigua]|uniref:Uncharacterized protein n=1 Tax=Spodoptera exigua TaxID=7107 RepID=A0A922MHV8_SPOEX|nr:hypothetical protein HF086_009812 [Spodoptera exigua]
MGTELKDVVRERVETQQDRRKECADKTKTPAEVFEVGGKVLLKSHVLSNAAKNITAKFVPKKAGPYVIVKRSALAADVPRAATRDSRLITPLVRISRKPTSDVWQAPALEINVDSGNVDGLASPWLALLRDNVSRHSGTRRAT